MSDGEFNMNYIRTYSPTGNNATTSIPQHSSLNHQLWNENIQYFDGLGRLCQNIDVKTAPGGGDLVTPVKYDDFGRQKWDYLPYSIVQDGANGPGGYRTDELTEQIAFQNYMNPNNGSFAKSTKTFDGSPLNRVKRQSSPGQQWAPGSGHEVEFEYLANTSTEPVLILEIAGNNALVKNNNYNAGTLIKSVTHGENPDEDENITVEYKNQSGQVVMKETWDGVLWLKTYYAYDIFGLLRYVIPPAAFSSLINQGGPEYTFLFNESWILGYCYYYQYDDRNRQIIKRLPGAEPVYMVYNQLDQLVLKQDGNLRGDDAWLFTKYDVFKRPVMTGKYVNSATIGQQAMQTLVDANQHYFETFSLTYTDFGYSNQAFPDLNPSNHNKLTVTWYDKYDFLRLENDSVDYVFDDTQLSFAYLEGGNESSRTKGMVTATKTFVLEHAGITATDNERLSVNYYDRYGRLIQVVADNHLGGKDIHSSNYNFTGDVIETKTDHQVPGNSMEVYNTYAYDKAKRLQWEKSLVTGDPDSVTLQKSVYDELGRLKRKYLHGDETGALQTVDYTYNIRDWLTGINNPYNPGSDYFAMSLGYTTGDNPQYNGNISEMHWKTVSFGFNDYQFDYDGANRLKEAVFTGTGQHNTSYSYDKNGNILSLTRQGQLGGGPEFGAIDELTYNYNGNQLNYVNDNEAAPYQDNGFKEETRLTTAEYTYDANGNMITDLNKNLVVNRYNYLNLPEEILMATDGLNTISYLYDATGNKLCKHVMHERMVEHTTDYCGGFVYEDDDLQYLLTSEGRVVFNLDGTHEYQYFLKDHLGNTRVTFGECGIIQEDSYYPFGMTMAGLSHQSGEDLPNKYLYNGKELQDDYGLDWYDYGARFYDPVIGRWHVVDPMAENYISLSPYHFSYNNTIRYYDMDGKKIGDKKSESTKRYKKSVKRTKRGRKVWRSLKHSKSNVYFHYIDESNDNLQKALGSGTEGRTFSGTEFNSAIKDGNVEYEKHNSFNPENGLWEANDQSEVHIIIDEDEISNMRSALNIEKTGEELDNEIDNGIHNVEVHEGMHATQEGYDYTFTDENGNNTGKKKPYLSRKAEIEAFEMGNKAEEELRNKKNK